MKRFSIVEKGYDINEVNRFIDIVIGRLEKLNAENAAYVAKIENLNKKIEENTKHHQNNNYDAKRLETAILAVTETADKIKEVSKEESRIILEEAKNNANSILHEALIKAEKTEQERMLLEKNMRIYKERIKNLIETQLEIVKDIDKIEL